MKRKIFILFLSLIVTNVSLAQASWCIVEKGTRFKVYQLSYADVDTDDTFLDTDAL
jgi:hypothetical protein